MGARNFRTGLLLLVTLTGMAVLIVEIAATRILAPYFGNSIFTLSSVISIILAALSAGYYLGGRLSDRQPSALLFCGLIVAAGFTVLLLQLLNALVLPGLAYTLSLVSGPLIVSLMMFLLPALLLGMLSPFAVRLLHAGDARQGVGNAAGLVFFWSTLGSIIGSLGAGFWLIPHFGIGHLMIGVGLGLVLLGGGGMLLFARSRKALPFGLILLGISCGYALLRSAEAEGKGIVHDKDGLYERIVIRDIAYQGRTARILLQDRNVSSGMFLDDGSMAFDYTKYFDLYRLFTPQLKSALAIGGGAYSVPKALLGVPTLERVDVAEIDPELHGLAQRYFALPEDARLHNHVVDGRRFLHDSAERYDLIFSDAYRSFVSAPVQFTTREFFELARSRLKEDGVFIANYYGSLGPETRPMLYAVLKTMRAAFPQVYVIATVDPVSDVLQNFIFIGHNAADPARRLDLERATGKDFAYPELREVARRELRPEAALLEVAFLLTDDYAPVEYYAADVIRRYDALSRKAH
jgi:spermidine synthase